MNYRYPAKTKFVSPKLVKLHLVLMLKKIVGRIQPNLKPEPNYRLRFGQNISDFYGIGVCSPFQSV